MAPIERLNMVWLEGSDCDGCTIAALGDPSAGGIEALLTGKAPGLPQVHLHHPILSTDSSQDFIERLESAAKGELDPYGVVVEASIPDETLAGRGFFSSLGQVNGKPITNAEWMRRLAPGALFVLSYGDCAVWGGPHSLRPNPTGSTGAAMFLGPDYRSALGLPVINLPGCAAPPVLISTLAALLRWMQGMGPPLDLDETNRPQFAYGKIWKGAFGDWRG